MTKVLVLYYSAYGHIETLANAIAEGARAEGAEVTVGRVPDNIPEDVAKAQHYKLDQTAPLIDHNTLPEYDAIIVGTGTRYGRISSQMAAFWDRTGGLWAKGALVGKVGASFTSSATQHGGQELTHISILSNLLHHGMTIVGLDYGFAGQMDNSAITGGSPYGVSTIAGGDGSMQPTQNDLDSAKYLGAKVARIAGKIIA